MNHTIDNHLEARRIEPRTAADAEVEAFWSKAGTALKDATSTGSSLENRLLRAYDAGRIAAFAIVREAGYRTRGGDSHHYVTFDVARSVATDADLRRSLDEMNGLRKVRHAVEYEAEDDVDEATVVRAVAVARDVITRGAVHLRSRRANLLLDDVRTSA